MTFLGALAVLVGWVTAVAGAVVARTFVEYPLVQASSLEPGAPLPALYLWVRIAYGTLAAAAGGLVTGWLAPRAPLRHGLGLALLVAGAALLYVLPDSPAEPAGHDAAALTLPPVAALLGTWLRGRGRT